MSEYQKPRPSDDEISRILAELRQKKAADKPASKEIPPAPRPAEKEAQKSASRIAKSEEVAVSAPASAAPEAPAAPEKRMYTSGRREPAGMRPAAAPAPASQPEKEEKAPAMKTEVITVTVPKQKGIPLAARAERDTEEMPRPRHYNRRAEPADEGETEDAIYKVFEMVKKSKQRPDTASPQPEREVELAMPAQSDSVELPDMPPSHWWKQSHDAAPKKSARAREIDEEFRSFFSGTVAVSRPEVERGLLGLRRRRAEEEARQSSPAQQIAAQEAMADFTAPISLKEGAPAQKIPYSRGARRPAQPTAAQQQPESAPQTPFGRQEADEPEEDTNSFERAVENAGPKSVTGQLDRPLTPPTEEGASPMEAAALPAEQMDLPAPQPGKDQDAERTADVPPLAEVSAAPAHPDAPVALVEEHPPLPIDDGELAPPLGDGFDTEEFFTKKADNPQSAYVDTPWPTAPRVKPAVAAGLPAAAMAQENLHELSAPGFFEHEEESGEQDTRSAARLAAQSPTQQMDSYPEEYTKPQDAPSVEAELRALRKNAGLRMAVTGLAAMLMIYLGLAAAGRLPALPFLDPAAQPFQSLIAQGVLFATALAVSAVTLTNGITGFWKEATADSLPAYASLAALVQLVYMLIPKDTAGTAPTLFAPVAAAALFFSALGKWVHSGVILKNFEQLNLLEPKHAAFRPGDPDLEQDLSKGLREVSPAVLLSRPVGFFDDFLAGSFAVRDSDYSAKRAALITAAVSLVAGAVSLFFSHDPALAISSFAAAGVLGGSFASSLVSAVPAALMQAQARQAGAVIPGWPNIKEAKATHFVAVPDTALFPEGTVQLHGIKTFERERLDLAILYAASVMVKASPTMKQMFLSVIEGKEGILYPVENLQEEAGKGFSGWIENNRVIVGNRQMMLSHEIDIPSLDYEQKFTKGNRKPLYLAVSGKVFSMFLVSYEADDQVGETLEALLRSGISVGVYGPDFSITPELVSEMYDLPIDYVKVLSAPERGLLQRSTVYTSSAGGAFSHLASFPSFIGGLRAALGAYSGERAAALVQFIGVVFAMAIAVLFAVTGGLGRLSLGAVLGFLAAWGALACLLPFARRD